MAADEKIIIAEKRDHPSGRSGGELHPLFRSRRPERQQGRDRRAIALRCAERERPVGARARADDQARRPARHQGWRHRHRSRALPDPGTEPRRCAGAADRNSSPRRPNRPPPPRKKTRPTKGSVERRLQSKAGRSTVKKLRRQGRARLRVADCRQRWVSIHAFHFKLQMRKFEAGRDTLAVRRPKAWVYSIS